MKYMCWVVGIAAIIVFAFAGCMPSSYTRAEHDERYAPSVEDTASLPPPMTVQDVINLAKAQVGDDVILAQMKSTESRFQLSSDDIINLKQAGVSEKVISAMIKSSSAPTATRSSSSQRVYVYSSPWYYDGWWDPWWYGPPVYLNFGYYARPHYRVGFGHYGVHAFGRHR